MIKAIRTKKKISRVKQTQAEDIMRDSRKSLAALIDFFPDATLAIDKDKRVIIWNRAMEKMSGVPASKMIGKGDYAYTVPFYGFARPQLMDLFWLPKHKIAKEYPVLKWEGENLVGEAFCPALRHGQGAYIWVKGSPIKNSAGKLIGAIECIRDITERKQAEELAEKSAKRYRGLFETSRDAIMTSEPPTWKFTSANSVTLKIFKAKNEAEFLSYPPWALSPKFQPDGRLSKEKAKEMIALAMKNGSNIFPWTHRTVDGKNFFAEVFLSRVKLGSKTFLQAIVRDITEKKKSDQKIVVMNRALRMLNESNQALIHATNEKKLLEKICRIVVNVGGYRMAWVGFAENDRAKSIRPMAQAGSEDGYTKSARFTWANTERGRGPSDVAVRTGQANIVKNITADSKIQPGRENASKRGPRSLIALPLSDGRQTFGALVIYSDAPEAFDKEEVKILKEFAADLSFGITTLKVRADSRVLEKELQIIFDNSADGILLAEASSGKFVRANRAICRMLGCRQADVEKMSIKDIHPKESLPTVLKQFDDMAQGRSTIAKNIPVKGKKGKIFYADISASVINLYGKKYVLGMFRDNTENKKFQENLVASETKYRSLFETAKDGIMIIDAKTGEISEVNRYLIELLGYSPERFLSKKIWEVDMFKSLIVSRESFESLKRKKYGYYENVFIKTRIGRMINTEIVFNVYPVNRAGVIQCNIRDVTARYNIELKLKNNEARFRAIYEESPIAIALVGMDNKFISVNRAAVDLWGYSDAELKKMTFLDITLPREIRRDIDSIKRLIKGDLDVYKIDKHYIRKDKTVISARINVTLARDADHNPLYFLAIIEDITDRHNWEKQIRKSEEKYSTLVEHSSDGVLVIQDGLIRFGNKAIQDISGYSLSEVIDRPLTDFIAEKYKKTAAERQALGFQTLPTAGRYEFELVKKNGQTVFVETNSSLIDFDGRMAVMAIIRDISRAKQIENIKSEFISVASHQLRTPLTGIKWFGQLLLENKIGKLSDKQAEFIRQIYDSNERMIRLVNDLLDVSHIETGHKFSINKRPEDILSLANDVIKDQLIASPDSDIRLVPGNNLPGKLALKFDRDKIYQALTNLVNNSIKYSGKNKKIIIGFKQTDGSLQVSVQDFGLGIPENQKSRIFQKFFRADNISSVSTNGTGLGLYIAKSIVEAHGGRMWFESQQDKGTTFYFTLPLKD